MKSYKATCILCPSIRTHCVLPDTHTHTQSLLVCCVSCLDTQPKFISKLWRDKKEGRDRESESLCGRVCVCVPVPSHLNAHQNVRALMKNSTRKNSANTQPHSISDSRSHKHIHTLWSSIQHHHQELILIYITHPPPCTHTHTGSRPSDGPNGCDLGWLLRN